MTPPRSDDEPRPAETTAATGDQWVIGHGEQRAIICEVGATLRAFTVAGEPVLDGFGADEWSHGGRGQVLAPWPNRLGDGRYTFEDMTAQAALDEIEHRNAIHGLVRWLPWRMSGRAQNRVSMTCELRPSPGYPFSLRLSDRVPAGPRWAHGDGRCREHRERQPPLRPRLPSLPHRRNGGPSTKPVSGCRPGDGW